MIPPSISDRIAERLDAPLINAAPYVEALRGVLREHRSREAQSYYGDRRLCCKTCHNDGTTPVWPCPTVAEIATSLGVEGDLR
jgi:hypothetical protein